MYGVRIPERTCRFGTDVSGFIIALLYLRSCKDISRC